MTRLLHVVTDPVSTRFLRGQLRWMADAGFDVHLAAAGGAELDAFGLAEGVTVHALPLVREPSPVADLRALLATVRLVRQLRPDVVNASTPKAGVLGTLAARLARVPVRVFVLRGLRFEGEQGGRRLLLRALDRVAGSCATHVVANSASLLEVAEAEGVVRPGRGVVLGAGSSNGVDVGRFAALPARAEARRAYGLPDDGRTIGLVGRLTRDKGVADAVEVFRRLAEDRADLGLLLLGGYEPGDPVPDDVRARIASDPRITVVDWVADAAAAYAAIDVLVFPSRREGLPNVVLEAQAAGVPVVAYAATGTRDAVRAGVTGDLVPVGDVAGLAESVGALLDDEARRARMGAAGRAWVAEAFEPRRVWAGLEALYRSAAD